MGKLVALAVLTKALVMTVLAEFILGADFLQSLILVIVSGTITGFGVVIAALVTARSMRPDRDTLHDIKRAVGAGRRTGDKANDQPPQ